MIEIPRIQEGIAASISANFADPKKSADWLVEQLTRIKLNNPIIAKVLIHASEKFGPEASAVGLMVYRMIESQIEANELKELIG